MVKPAESSQLPLSVTVSVWSGVMHNFKKTLREFRYTPLVQILSNYLFWVNVGVLCGVYLILQQYTNTISNGFGIVFAPGSKSTIPLFVSSAVKELSILPTIWYVMVIVWLAFSFASMIVHSSGRYGMANYLFAISLLLLLLMAKIILMPLLLIGG